MKKRHRLQVALAFSLILTLLFAFAGCGSSEGSSENTTEKETSIDMNYLETIDGGYNCYGIYSGKEKLDDKHYLHLEIEKKDSETGTPYLTIFDQEAGNPGVEGEIVYLDDKTIKIKVAKDFYEELPSDTWTLTDDEFLEMTYEMAQMGIVLTNNGVYASFWFDDIDMSEDQEAAE